MYYNQYATNYYLSDYNNYYSNYNSNLNSYYTSPYQIYHTGYNYVIPYTNNLSNNQITLLQKNVSTLYGKKNQYKEEYLVKKDKSNKNLKISNEKLKKINSSTVILF
jgi:hypothetical protein